MKLKAMYDSVKHLWSDDEKQAEVGAQLDAWGGAGSSAFLDSEVTTTPISTPAPETDTVDPELMETSADSGISGMFAISNGEEGGTASGSKRFSKNAETFEKLVAQTMIRWAEEETINDPRLVREIFNLLYRQYSCVDEVSKAVEKTYCIAEHSKEDTINLLSALGHIRSLLQVQMGAQEEAMIMRGLTEIMNNRVFYGMGRV